MELTNLRGNQYVELDPQAGQKRRTYKAPKSKKTLYLGMTALVITSLALYLNRAQGPMPGVFYSAHNVPAFSTANLSPEKSTSNAMIFKANVLAQMLGFSEGSTFANVLNTWDYHLQHFQGEMSVNDVQNAVIIKKLMKMYLAKKSGNSLEYQNFWMKILPTFGMKNKQNLVAPAGLKATNKAQLKFWMKAENMISLYKNGKWVSSQGKIVKGAQGSLIAKTRVADSLKNYWVGAWGPEPVQDTLGNSLYTRQNIAAEIYNHNSENFDFNFDMKSAVQFESLRFLNIFESARLGNKIDQDDHQFCSAVEAMIMSWVQNPKSELIQSVKDVFRF